MVVVERRSNVAAHRRRVIEPHAAAVENQNGRFNDGQKDLSLESLRHDVEERLQDTRSAGTRTEMRPEGQREVAHELVCEAPAGRRERRETVRMADDEQHALCRNRRLPAQRPDVEIGNRRRHLAEVGVARVVARRADELRCPGLASRDHHVTQRGSRLLEGTHGAAHRPGKGDPGMAGARQQLRPEPSVAAPEREARMTPVVRAIAYS